MKMLDCKPHQYPSPDQKSCCDRCPAGTYIRNDCNSTTKTECDECRRGYYTRTSNHLRQCRPCTVCHSSSNQRTVKNCTADEDTQCECVPEFYCSEISCEHCRPASRCPVGEGVKVKATRTGDTVCAPCQDGTYSNVSDFHSACRPHTSCEALGRELETPGTSSVDAVCGRFISQCPWILPASLWSGIVLTLLVLLGIIYWRAKRKSRRTVFSSVADAAVELVPSASVYALGLPLPSTECNGHCEASYEEKSFEHAHLDSDDKMVNCWTQDIEESNLPTTPLAASVHLGEPNHINGNAGNCSRNSLRTHSEPQEDEWCGT